MTEVPAHEPGFVTFDTLTAEQPETADALVDAIVAEAAGRLRHSPGFLSSRVHVSPDRRTVVHRALWRGAADHHAAFPDGGDAGVSTALTNRPGVRTATAFRGSPAPGINGPQFGRQPGWVAVATRHLRDRDSFDALTGLLASSGEWKRHHRGFISATPHISRDGLTFVNYAMWEDADSYRAWMADPRISEGQEEIARLESAPPEYVLCTVAADIEAA
ncbi:antibiotic biosynthesis monooxygenase family protein [Streptomyces cellulosae]|uniref:antibiotic biosynthesis monooxygenase family protein n=1 Tax=Streptomyces cellulosae TaxID=1968 RepID=UPI00068F81DF|nr:antibiotic biosynthesis monooxygenase [Streptomyces cellulosae]